MRILIVKKERLRPFVNEQTDSIKRYYDIDFVYHNIQGKGILAYICDIPKLVRDVKQIEPHIIHVHYGLSGFYVCMILRLMFPSKKIPLIITYHGSDINNAKIRKLSQKAIDMADYNIFVSPKLVEKVHVENNSQVIPCGINWEDWPDMQKIEARRMMGMKLNKKYVLFSGNFLSPIKNYMLAKQAVDELRLQGIDIELMELKGYARPNVNRLMHAVDVCLMTSFSEGSPQFIKEAMVCGCPIVTTRVGDSEYVIGDTDGCFFTDYSPMKCAEQLRGALQYAQDYNRTRGRKRIEILGYGNEIVAQKIMQVYNSLMHKE